MLRKSSVALALVCALFFALAARAQEVTPAEKDKALALLESTKKDVLDATKGLSTAQWNFKSAPDRWSIAECMEHIAAAEDYIRGSVESGVMKAPAVPGRDVWRVGRRPYYQRQGHHLRDRAACRRLDCGSRAARRVLSLPLFPELTESEVDRVCEMFLRVARP